MDRILVVSIFRPREVSGRNGYQTMRKASTSYYPTLHLELARYVSLLRAASPNARLPHLIEKLVGSPPDAVKRRCVDAPSGALSMPSPFPSDGSRRGAWAVA